MKHLSKTDFAEHFLKCEFEKILRVLYISPKDLQDDTIGTSVSEGYRNSFLGKRTAMDGYTSSSKDYTKSVTELFERYLRTEENLEDIIEIYLKQNISNFVTFELPPGNYSPRHLNFC